MKKRNKATFFLNNLEIKRRMRLKNFFSSFICLSAVESTGQKQKLIFRIIKQLNLKYSKYFCLNLHIFPQILYIHNLFHFDI